MAIVGTTVAAVVTFTVSSGCSDSETSIKPQTKIYFKRPERLVTYKRPDGTAFLVGERQVVLALNENTSEEDRQKVHDWLTARDSKQVGFIDGMNIYQYELKKGDDLGTVLNELKKMGAVRIASPNRALAPMLDPQPNLSSDLSSGHWWIDRIKLRRAWDLTTGSEKVPIGIVDSRLPKDDNHFLGKRIIFPKRCIGVNQSLHFFKSDEDLPDGCTLDTGVYGTHGIGVAALAASRGDDYRGGVGVAWKSPIINAVVPHKTALFVRENLYTEIMGAVRISMEMGAKVVIVSHAPVHWPLNLSDKKQDHEEFRDDLRPAIQYARQNDVLVVFSAGNCGFKQDDNWLLSGRPAADSEYFKSNVIFVGATDDANNPACRSKYSVLVKTRPTEPCKCPDNTIPLLYGNDMTVEGKVVELSAPGYNVAIPDLNGSGQAFKITGGTSYSAPMVGGGAALIWSVNPSLKAKEVKQILLQTAQKGLSKCRDIGHGILDVEAAVKSAKGISGGKITTFVKQGLDVGCSAIQSTDSGYLVAGTSSANLSFIKTDKNLNKVWDRIILSKSLYVQPPIVSVERTNDGGYIVIANGNDGGSGYDGTGHLIKTDAAGKTSWNWNSYLDGAVKITMRSVQQTQDSGYIVLASDYGKTWLSKFDANGAKKWTVTSFSRSYPGSAIQTSDGGFALAGSDTSGWLIKTDNQGKKTWEVSYTGKFHSVSLQQTNDGGYVIATGSLGLIKTDVKGSVIWNGKLGCAESTPRLYSVRQTTDGGYVATGEKNKSAWLIKIDASGKQTWEKTYVPNGYFYSLAYTVRQVNDGGYLMAGKAVSTADPSDVLLIKTDKNGNAK